MRKPQSELAETKKLMGALVRMKPKPHDEMKIGKIKPKASQSLTKNRRRRAASRANGENA